MDRYECIAVIVQKLIKIQHSKIKYNSIELFGKYVDEQIMNMTNELCVCLNDGWFGMIKTRSHSDMMKMMCIWNVNEAPN